LVLFKGIEEEKTEQTAPYKVCKGAYELDNHLVEIASINQAYLSIKDPNGNY